MILRQISDSIGLKPINFLQTNTVSTIPDSVQTTLITLNASQDHHIMKISCSGDAYAKYQLYINNNLIETKKVGNRNVEFIFSAPLLLQNTEILDIKVTHYYIGKTFDFSATIYSRI